VLESAAPGDRVTAVLATTSLAALSVPATLHASLMARLDRLGPAPKEIAQIGAVLGREFAYELIEPVAQHPEKELQAALDQLSDAGLLFCRGTNTLPGKPSRPIIPSITGPSGECRCADCGAGSPVSRDSQVEEGGFEPLVPFGKRRCPLRPL
jgi:hypothetical protein